jgi:hypothetical protein
MKATLITTDGNQTVIDGEGGWQQWNEAIGAHTGTIVTSPDGSIELWCDDEGLFKEDARQNIIASILVKQPIVGDVIAFPAGSIK